MTAIDVRARILFVTPVSPFSSASGSEQRSAIMLTALASVGQVDVLQLTPGAANGVVCNQEGEHLHVSAMLAGSDRSIFRYRPKADATRNIELALGRDMAQYQLIVGRYVWPVCQLVIPPYVPIIADLDDFRFRFSPAFPWTLTAAKDRLLKAVAHTLAKRQLKRFSGVFVVSAQDQHELASHSALPIEFLPNVPFSVCAKPDSVPINQHVLFVGSLWYRPNIDGINWFLRHIWPTVLVTVPAAKLNLVGSAPKSVLTQWSQQPGVQAPGFVDDLAEIYRQARLVVVPLLAGGGTNIKVLEALTYGRPCLVTQFVANAFVGHLAAGKEILVAGDAAEFAKAICAALLPGAQPELQRLALAGRTAVEMSFTPASFKEHVANFAQTLLAAAHRKDVVS